MLTAISAHHRTSSKSRGDSSVIRAFTFSYAAAATDALEWISRGRSPGATAYSVIVGSAITVLVGMIAAGPWACSPEASCCPIRPPRFPAASPASAPVPPAPADVAREPGQP